MQKYKPLFKDINHKGTVTNIQSCLRLNDLEEIGDGTHCLSFDMLGLFSFRDWSVKKTIDFWLEFLDSLGIIPDYITIHPDKKEWKEYYSEYNIEIRYDKECVWTDGDISGYSTEFYKNDIEIGNIVNPLGDCIDVGFGLNRIEMILNNETISREMVLKETIFKIINSGYKPTYNKQGSLLRKLLRICYLEGIIIEHEFYEIEIERQEKILSKYNRLKDKHKDKSKDWWWSTFGIDLNLIE